MLKKKRKGFDLIQLIIFIVVVAILATVAFLSGSRLMNSAKISAVRSDCQSFELAAKQLLLEHPDYIQLKSTATTFIANRISDFNRYLPTELQVSGTSTVLSAKLDNWSNNYRVVFHTDNTHSSFFRIYIISSGINGTSPSDGTVDKDDLIMTVELKDGNAKSGFWGFDTDNTAATALTSLVP